MDPFSSWFGEQTTEPRPTSTTEVADPERPSRVGPVATVAMTSEDPFESYFEPRRAFVEETLTRAGESAQSFERARSELERYGIDTAGLESVEGLRESLDLGAARREQAGKGLSFSESYKKSYLPFGSVIPDRFLPGDRVPGASEYSDAMKRLQDGKSQPGDAETVAIYERQSKAEADVRKSAGFGEKLVYSLGGLGTIGAEAMVGGGVLGRVGSAFGRGGRAATTLTGAAAPAVPELATVAATGLGRRAATYALSKVPATLVTPSLYVPMAQQKNLSEGRGANDWRGFPSALGYGYATMLVLGQLQGGVKGNLFVQSAKKGGLASAELQGVDLLAGVADEFLPKAYAFDTGYGTLGKLVKARGDAEFKDALEEAAVQSLAFGLFAAAHGRTPEAQGISKAFADASKDLKSRGFSSRYAGEQVKSLHSRLESELKSEPYISRESASALFADVKDPALRRYADELVKAFEPARELVPRPEPVPPASLGPSLPRAEGYEPLPRGASFGPPDLVGLREQAGPPDLVGLREQAGPPDLVGLREEAGPPREQAGPPEPRRIPQELYGTGPFTQARPVLRPGPRNLPSVPGYVPRAATVATPEPPSARIQALPEGPQNLLGLRRTGDLKSGRPASSGSVIARPDASQALETRIAARLGQTVDWVKKNEGSRLVKSVRAELTEPDPRTGVGTSLGRNRDAATVDRGVYVDVDVDNAGGLTKRLGSTEATEALSLRFLEEVRSELKAAGGDVRVYKHGADKLSDEFSAIVEGVDRPSVDAAMRRASERIRELVRSQGLSDVPHPKPGRPAGSGISYGTAELARGRDVKSAFSDAELATEASKRSKSGRPLPELATPAGTLALPRGTRLGTSKRQAGFAEARFPFQEAKAPETDFPRAEAGRHRPSPGTPLAKLQDAIRSSVNPLAREYMLDAEWNSRGEQSIRDASESEAEYRSELARDTLEKLQSSVTRAVVNKAPSEAIKELRKAAESMGIEYDGKEGDIVPLDPIVHHTGTSEKLSGSPGDKVRLVSPPAYAELPTYKERNVAGELGGRQLIGKGVVEPLPEQGRPPNAAPESPVARPDSSGVATVATHEAPSARIQAAPEGPQNGFAEPPSVPAPDSAKPPSPDTRPIWGEAAPDSVVATKARLKEWGVDADAPDFEARMRALATAPEGSDVRVKRIRDNNLMVSFSIKDSSGTQLGSGERVIHQEEDGLHAMNLFLDLEAYRAAGGKESGTELFARQLEELRRLGVKELTVVASSAMFDHKGLRPANGYYTWAVLGYDGPIPAEVIERLPPSLAELARRGPGPLVPDNASVLKLVSTPEGRKWWKENGDEFVGWFDTAPNSPNSLALARYISERKSRNESPIEAPKGDPGTAKPPTGRESEVSGRGTLGAAESLPEDQGSGGRETISPDQGTQVPIAEVRKPTPGGREGRTDLIPESGGPRKDPESPQVATVAKTDKPTATKAAKSPRQISPEEERALAIEQWQSADDALRQDPTFRAWAKSVGIDVNSPVKERLSSRGPRTTENVANAEVFERIEAARDTLSNSQHKFLTEYSRGKSIESIAREFGVSKQYVSRELQKSLKRLKESDEYFDQFEKYTDLLSGEADVADAVRRLQARERRGEVELDEFGRVRTDSGDAYFSGAPVRLTFLEGLLGKPRQGESSSYVSSKVGRFLRAFYSPRGGLPEEAFRAKQEELDRPLAVAASQVAAAGRDFRAAVKSSGVRYEDLTAYQVRLLDDVLRTERGTPQRERAATAARLRGSESGARIEAALDQMRSQIDGLSRKLVRSGVLSERLEGVVNKNLGTYLTRQYQAFDDPRWFEKVAPEVVNRFKSFYRAEAVRLALEANGRLSPKDRRPVATVASEVAAELTPERLEGVVNELLKNETAADNPIAFFKASRLGSEDLGILTSRKELPAELRALWGEYRDPLVNYVNSVARMSQLLASNAFLTRVAREGAGKFVFDRPTGEFFKPVAAEGDVSMGALAGKYTTPEVAKAFQEAFSAKELPWLYKGYMKAVALAKYAKTALSHTTHITNFLSNVGFAVMNGHWRVNKLPAALRSVVSDTPEARAYYDKLISLGVFGEGLNYNEFRNTVRDAFESRESLLDSTGVMTDRGILRAIRKAGNLASKAYSAEDAVWKAYAFENELARYKSAHPDWSAEQLDKAAAEIVRATYPTYSLAPEALKKARALPIAPFATFPAEVIRTTVNTVRLAFSELSDPATRSVGATRLAGIAAAAAGSYALATVARAVTGTDAEDEDALRRFFPEYQRESRVMQLTRGKSGSYRYIDLSRLDPHAHVLDAVAAFSRGKDAEDGTRRAIEELVKPYVSEDMVTRVVLDIARNRKEPGGRVYNPSDSPGERAKDVRIHALRAFTPGGFSAARRLRMAASGTPEQSSGKAYDAGDEAFGFLSGQRVNSIDLAKELTNRARAFSAAKDEAESMTNRLVRAGGPVTNEELEGALSRTNPARLKAFEEMRLDVLAARRLGLADDEIVTSLKRAGLSRDELSAVMTGNFPTMTPSVRGRPPEERERAIEVRKMGFR